MPNHAPVDSEQFAAELMNEMRLLHRSSLALPLGARGQQRERVRRLLRQSGKPALSDTWIVQLESALYTATSCAGDPRYSTAVRNAAANLRRSESAHKFPAEAWPFLPLIVLARDNRPVHLERIRHQIDIYERTHHISELDRARLTAEIDTYSVAEPELHQELAARLADKPVAEVEDWESDPCPHCGSLRTRFLYELQIRSADEPMTQYHTCTTCSQNFTLN